MIEHNPYGASHGLTSEAWSKVAPSVNVENSANGDQCYAKVNSLITKYKDSLKSHLIETGVTENDNGDANELLPIEKATADVMQHIEDVKNEKKNKADAQKVIDSKQELLRNDASKRRCEKDDNPKPKKTTKVDFAQWQEQNKLAKDKSNDLMNKYVDLQRQMMIKSNEQLEVDRINAEARLLEAQNNASTQTNLGRLISKIYDDQKK